MFSDILNNIIMIVELNFSFAPRRSSLRTVPVPKIFFNLIKRMILYQKQIFPASRWYKFEVQV